MNSERFTVDGTAVCQPSARRTTKQKDAFPIPTTGTGKASWPLKDIRLVQSAGWPTTRLIIKGHTGCVNFADFLKYTAVSCEFLLRRPFILTNKAKYAQKQVGD